MFDWEQDIFLIFEHFEFFRACDGILFDELQSAVLRIEFALRQIYLGKTSRAQVINNLKIFELKEIITQLFFEQNWRQSDLPDFSV